jgi:hypothetical protein
MKTYRFKWADGEISYESFNSKKEVYQYLEAMEQDGYPPCINWEIEY